MRSGLTAVVLAACAGDATVGEGPPTFTQVRDEILLPTCGFSSCHGSGSGGLTLDEAGAYDALVDAPSAVAVGEILVIPSDPDGSYLVKKLEGTSGIVGDVMPVGGALDPEEIALVRDWIAAGAAND